MEIKEGWIITTDKFTSVETLWKVMHRRWDIENNAFHQLKTEWHLDHCFLYSPAGIETVLMFIIIAFNLMQLYFFRCIKGFRKKCMLQIYIKDERLTIENGWDNPLFEKT
ncbi:transposase [Clostridium sp. JN-1]|uniref:transposase n=1 Tax=Clostridium sp. JN-1 TaxID=2483110 RepID=UPI000F0B6FC6|nr:transposase [Clostridium sp. JN-1]